MKFLSLLHEKAGFTQNEAKVVLFLSTTFLIGLAVQWLRPGAAGTDSGTPYDYRLADSEFIARSRSLDSLPVEQAQRAGASLREPKKLPPRSSIDLNSATEQELMRLPGIGPQVAARIVQHRDEHGAFASVDDLLDVRGIGPKKLEAVRPFVTVQ
jgi:competence protein ComEA